MTKATILDPNPDLTGARLDDIDIVNNTDSLSCLLKNRSFHLQSPWDLPGQSRM